MSYALPNGSTINVGIPKGAPLAFSGIGSASGDVTFTVTGATIATGDVVLVRSPNAALDGLVLKAKTATATMITCSGVNASDTARFPANTTGTLAKLEAADWTQIPLVTAVAVSGGEQQTTSVQFLESDAAINVNTFKSALSQTFTIAHDSASPARAKLIQADDSDTVVAVWFRQPRAKEDRYYAAEVAIQRVPKTAVNEIEVVDVTFNLKNEVTYYPIS